MKRYLLPGIVGAVLGAILGVVSGVILLVGSLIIHGQEYFEGHLAWPLISAVVSTITLVFLGLIIGLIIAAVKKPKS